MTNPTAPLRRCFVRLVLPLAGLLGAGTVSGKTFCVGTGNELSTAMETAAFNQQSDEIRIRTGTLTRSGASGVVPRWEYDNGPGNGDVSYDITISGGWVDCSTQTNDPRLTVLDAQYQGSAVSFNIYDSRAHVKLSNLTITRGYNSGDALARNATNLSVEADFSSATVEFDRLIVVAGSSADANHGAAVGIRGFSDGGGTRPTFALRNSVVAYNQSAYTAGVEFNLADAAVMLTNNSIFSNTITADPNCGCVGVDLVNGGGVSYVTNNVIVGNLSSANVSRDLGVETGSAYLRNNHVGSAHFAVAPVVNLNATTGSPKWTITGIYPKPDADSPLRNSGVNAPAGGVGTFDLTGKARVAEGTVDRGAVESDAVVLPPDTIFANAFE